MEAGMTARNLPVPPAPHRSPARADTIDGLTSLCKAAGLRRESWYGVRIASDDQDLAEPVPADEAELARMLEIEERLGRTDP
jgi:hypothetical protein